MFDGRRAGFPLPRVFQGPVQLVERGGKLLYPLSHLAAPFIVFSNLGFSFKIQLPGGIPKRSKFPRPLGPCLNPAL